MQTIRQRLTDELIMILPSFLLGEDTAVKRFGRILEAARLAETLEPKQSSAGSFAQEVGELLTAHPSQVVLNRTRLAAEIQRGLDLGYVAREDLPEAIASLVMQAAADSQGDPLFLVRQVAEEIVPVDVAQLLAACSISTPHGSIVVSTESIILDVMTKAGWWLRHRGLPAKVGGKVVSGDQMEWVRG